MQEELSPLTKLMVRKTVLSRFIDSYDDPVCGEYALYDNPSEPPNRLDDIQLFSIAKVLATQKIRGRYVPTIITSSVSGQYHEWVKRTTSELLSEYPSSINTEIDEALINISKALEYPSDIYHLNELSRWYIFSHDQKSEEYMVSMLIELNYIKRIGNTRGDQNKFQVTANGWSRIDELQTTNSDSNQAFVAMWFAPEMQEYYTSGIHPAIEGTGFKPLRIDRKEHNNKICDEIIFEIKRSRFLVADFTGERGGVYFEAGYAHGLGIPVIWIVHESEIDKVHFDTRQYNHITYNSSEDLKEKLMNRVKATIS